VWELILLGQSDFLLNEVQFHQINEFIAQKANEYAALGEDAASGVSVIFSFSPMGKDIEVQFDGGPAFSID